VLGRSHGELRGASNKHTSNHTRRR
jgi:hypothetical protein